MAHSNPEQLDLDFTPRPTRPPEHADLGVIQWVTQSDLEPARRVDARHELGWWEMLPGYERDRYRREYEYERGRDEGRLRPYSRACPPISPEVSRMEEESVQRWAGEIRRAAIEGRPMPYAPCEHMTGFELLAFQSRLHAACLVAGAFIIPQASPETQKKGKRK